MKVSEVGVVRSKFQTCSTSEIVRVKETLNPSFQQTTSEVIIYQPTSALGF
jgi:hypothetical protein